MLKHLTIRNYALIRHLELSPSRHLNVITGETGAGKSIMLGAMGLLMGNRADTRVLWDESGKCVIEGTFDIKHYNLGELFKAEDLDFDDQAVIRREISAGGKSRAFVNDTPVTLDVMRKIGSVLMDIHSQHETLQLGNQAFQLQLIDAFANNAIIREKYHEAWAHYLKTKNDFETLAAQAGTLRQEADFTRFQLDELDTAHLEENEQERLESELKILEHTEEIKSKFVSILQLITSSEYGVQPSLAAIRAQLQSIATFSTAYESLFQRLESVRLELNDIVGEIEKEESRIEFDPQRFDWINARLGTIYNLLKKHRLNSIAELQALQAALRQKSDLTANLDDELKLVRTRLDTSTSSLKKIAAQLSESRKSTFAQLCKQLVGLLKELGIPNASLSVDHQVIDPAPTGADKLEILFSANKGIAEKPLAQVASGGEFSRLMFCIKYIMAERSAMPTLVLDEIDNGVSGEIAIRLGALMKSMSKGHQLIAITHLPQIAASGDSHYYVFKDNSASKTVSNIRLLTADERVDEIAKMIGGATPSKVARANAQELLTSR